MTNQRLSGAEACSDKAIAVVTMLAMYQRMHHQQSIGLVHFDGLRRMIELRGGLAQLALENRTLAQKPWRLSLEFALQDGSSVAFDVVDISQPSQLLDSRFISISISTLDTVLRRHFSSITQFTHLLNNSTDNVKIGPLDYSDAVCLRLHKLLDYAPLATHHRLSMSPLDDLVHLTLVAVMTTLMPEYGHNQARYDLLASKLQSALQRYAATEDRSCEILLWALFVGYATVLGESHHIWLVALAKEVGASLHSHTWMDICRLLSAFGWIGVFYNKAGSKLWFEMNSHNREVVV
jgi:hypothetical protein